MIYRQILPYALALGVSYETFWDINPYILDSFREAHRIKRKMEDESQWTNGQYMLNALIVALDKAFNGQKAVAEYPEKPLYADILSSPEEREINEQLENRRALEQFEREQAALRANFYYNKKLKEREEQGKT